MVQYRCYYSRDELLVHDSNLRDKNGNSVGKELALIGKALPGQTIDKFYGSVIGSDEAKRLTDAGKGGYMVKINCNSICTVPRSGTV